jgi:hypothetical protein
VSAAGRLLVGCAAVVALSGCAAVHAASSPMTALPVSASGQAPKQRAEADVLAIMTRFAPPADATQVSAAPVAGLAGPTAPTPGSSDVVTRTTWWVAPGDPRKLLAWEAAHLPRPFRLYSTNMVGRGSWDGDITIWGDDFSLPDVKGVLISRGLSVAVTADGRGKTAFQVQSVSQWLPALTAADMLPAAARVVTISENPGANAHGEKPQAPATISVGKEVARIVALINAQPLFPPGRYNCPADDGQNLTMEFRAEAGGPVIATAVLDTSGCESIGITVGGKDKPARGLALGRGVAAKSLQIAGLHWMLPAFP